MEKCGTYNLGLKRVREEKRKIWSQTDIQYVKDNFATLSKEQLKKHLGRTWLSIQNKAHKLGLTRSFFRQKEWTEEEDAILREMYPQSNKEKVLQKLDWDWRAICRRAERIGVKRNLSYIHKEYRDNREGDWTDRELKYLEENFADATQEEMEEVLCRQWATIVVYGCRKGLRRNKRLAYERRRNPQKWSKEESDVLHKEYDGTEESVERISKQIERSSNAIKNRAFQQGLLLKINRWTLKEDKILQQHFPDGDPLKILDFLPGRTWTSIGQRARQILNLKRKTNILYSERRMKRLLDKIYPNDEYQDNVRPDWLVNPETGKLLELDRYYPQLNLAFEYNGLQHYEVCFGNSKEHERNRLLTQRQRDKAKQELCKKQGVTLVVVTYNDFLTVRCLKDLVTKYTKLNGFLPIQVNNTPD